MEMEAEVRTRGRPRVVEAAPVAEAPKHVYPAKIKMQAPFGFVDEQGNNKYWHQWQEVSDPEEIKMIIDHGFRNFRRM